MPKSKPRIEPGKTGRSSACEIARLRWIVPCPFCGRDNFILVEKVKKQRTHGCTVCGQTMWTHFLRDTGDIEVTKTSEPPGK